MFNRLVRRFIISFSVVILVIGMGIGVSHVAASEIHEEVVIEYDDEAEVFEMEYTYSVPDGVESLTIEYLQLQLDLVRVIETENVRKIDETTYEWDEQGTPVLRLEHKVSGETFTEGAYGYATDKAAFTGVPNGRLSYTSSNLPHEHTSTQLFKGEGYAGNGYVYAGKYEKYSDSIENRDVELIIVDEVSQPVDEKRVLDLYADGERYLDGRFDHDRVTLFVLPTNRRGDRPAGHVSGRSIWIEEEEMDTQAIDNIPAHEYIHAIFGVFGSGEMYWLTEGSAEYYGYLLALNSEVGTGTFEEFHRSVTTDRYSTAVLTDTAEMRQTSADYHKGAHVLAALDAEIRDRSNGQSTLLDVILTSEHDLTTYAGFQAAVVDASTDPSMDDWLDTYVQTDAVPEVPEDRRFYTLGDRSPDSIPTATSTDQSPDQETTTSESPRNDLPIEHISFEPLPWGEIWNSMSPSVSRDQAVAREDLRPAMVTVVDDFESEGITEGHIDRGIAAGFLIRTEDGFLKVNYDRIDAWYTEHSPNPSSEETDTQEPSTSEETDTQESASSTSASKNMTPMDYLAQYIQYITNDSKSGVGILLVGIAVGTLFIRYMR